ncbi:AAA family ATPase [Spirosoma litoris]
MEQTINALTPFQNVELIQKGITFDGLQAEISRQSILREKGSDHIGAFLIRSAADWIAESKKLPTPKGLFDKFWFEGEICILFASSNQGKSLLAVQIANSISTGFPIDGFKFDSGAQKVIYIDFEMSTKQFEARYCESGTNHFQWSDNLQRCEIDPDAELPAHCKNPEDYLVDSIEQVIIRTDAKVIILDNLTYLASDTETAKGAAPLMKQLKQLKTQYGLSLLVLAHTPKREITKPITQNDLQGSSRLMQFCDSSFAIGASSQGSSTKYLKQIKARNTAIEYDAENVIVCHIQKEGSFLSFKLVGYGKEWEHLKPPSNEENTDRNTKILELHAEGKTQREIASEVGTSVATVNRLLKAATPA